MKKTRILNLLIFCIIFTLFGCSEDLFDNAHYQTNFKISHKKFEDLIVQPKFKNAILRIEKIKEKQNISVNKTVMEDQYGFTITENNVNVIENDTLISYTLFVTRENTPKNIVENLIIQVKSQNEINAYLLKYTSDSDFYDSFNMKDFQGAKSLTQIIYNSNQTNISGKMIYIETCSIVTSWYCYGPGNHCDSEGCTMGFPINEQICTTSSYDDGISSSSSGGSGGNTGDILTAPHGGGSGTSGSDLTPDPCKSLKKVNLKVKASLNSLSIDASTQENGEYGYSFQVNNYNNMTPPIDLGYSPDNFITIPYGSNVFGAAHTHPLKTYPMFSFSDVITLFNIYNQANDTIKGDVVFMLVNPDGSVYAIKIDDIDVFRVNIQAKFNATGIYGEKNRIKATIAADSNLAGKYASTINPTDSVNLSRTFLDYFNGSGMSLYKSTGNFDGWKKLSLPINPSSPTLTETPCN